MCDTNGPTEKKAQMIYLNKFSPTLSAMERSVGRANIRSYHTANAMASVIAGALRSGTRGFRLVDPLDDHWQHRVAGELPLGLVAAPIKGLARPLIEVHDVPILVEHKPVGERGRAVAVAHVRLRFELYFLRVIRTLAHDLDDRDKDVLLGVPAAKSGHDIPALGVFWDEAAREAECEHVEVALYHVAELGVPVLHRHVSEAFERARDNGVALGAGEAGENVHWVWLEGRGSSVFILIFVGVPF